MTLIVSLRIPDGIVIAGDSLASMVGQGELSTVTKVTCPACGHQHEVSSVLPMPPVVSTTFPYAQKVFSFGDKYGIGTFGGALILGKSIYFIMRFLEKQIKEFNLDFNNFTLISETISGQFHNLFYKQLEKENISEDQLSDDKIYYGFHIVGYDELEPKSIEILVGKTVKTNISHGMGFTYSGDGQTVEAIRSSQKEPGNEPPYFAFSLQDAIDYADFLIRATISDQRFSNTTPSVGGDIDIALVTPFDGFQWIRQKELGIVLKDKKQINSFNERGDND